MPKLNLTSMLACKGDWGDVLALKGAGFAWTKPVTGIAAHYGTGPGMVPIHHKPSDPANITTDSGLVTGSVNLGGAGPYFDLAGLAGRQPGYSDGAFQFANVSNKALHFANAADLAGVHLVVALKIGALSETYLAITSDGGLWQRVYVRSNVSPAQFNVMTRSKAILISGQVSIGDDEWALAELRMDAAGCTVLMNGAILKQNATAVSSYLITSLGYGGNQSQRTIGSIGDFASVICAAGSSAASPEAAVLEARAEIAGNYGITLS